MRLPAPGFVFPEDFPELSKILVLSETEFLVQVPPVSGGVMPEPVPRNFYCIGHAGSG